MFRAAQTRLGAGPEPIQVFPKPFLRELYSVNPKEVGAVECPPNPSAPSVSFFSLQVLLIISGNLSFLNWLTIVPSIACFDDRSLAFLFSPRRGGVKERVLQLQGSGEQPPPGLGEFFWGEKSGQEVCLSQKLSLLSFWNKREKILPLYVVPSGM